MKNKMTDVRNHLVAMLEELGDPGECKPETIERAKAMSQVAGTYIQAVKTEVDAIRVAADYGALPTAIEAPRTGGGLNGASIGHEH